MAKEVCMMDKEQRVCVKHASQWEATADVEMRK